MKKIFFLVFTAALLGGCSSDNTTTPPTAPRPAEPALRFSRPSESKQSPVKRRNRAAAKNFTPETQIMR